MKGLAWGRHQLTNTRKYLCMYTNTHITHQRNFSTWKASHWSEKHAPTMLWSLLVIHLMFSVPPPLKVWFIYPLQNLPPQSQETTPADLGVIWLFSQYPLTHPKHPKFSPTFCIKAKQENKWSWTTHAISVQSKKIHTYATVHDMNTQIMHTSSGIQ